MSKANIPIPTLFKLLITKLIMEIQNTLHT